MNPPNPYPSGPPGGIPTIPAGAASFVAPPAPNIPPPQEALVLPPGVKYVIGRPTKRNVVFVDAPASPEDVASAPSYTPSSSSADYTLAPLTSHIARFKLEDGDDYDHAGAKRLHVVFRNNKEGIEDSEYVFFFTNHTLADDIFNRLSFSPHPYGAVLYPEVIKPKIIDYKPVWKR